MGLTKMVIYRCRNCHFKTQRSRSKCSRCGGRMQTWGAL